MLTLKNLDVFVEEKQIIKDLNYVFEKNKVYAVMGPNGSGKSTLAYAIIGHPHYRLSEKSKIIFNNKDIKEDGPDKRAKKGIFVSFQQPLSLQGVSVFQLLRLALTGKIDPLTLKKKIEKISQELEIKKELIERSLNDGASGGERKKLELLQGVILNPKLMIFDEIDTGIDVDSLKKISLMINKIKKNKTIVLITHYNRILKYIKPDKVLILKEGKIIKEGDYLLAEEIEKKGYSFLK